MKKYFFGYLFVRIAKFLAVIIVLIGLAYAIFQFVQASVAAESVQYLPNPTVRQHLDKLLARSFEAQRLVSDFTGETKKSDASVGGLAGEITSMRDFDRLGEVLETVDREREILKQAIVKRFEQLIDEVQKKLRAYAASLSPAEASPPPKVLSPTPMATATPPPKPTPNERKTLFSEQLSQADIETRLSDLNANVQFLKVLETTAENPENRTKLTESIKRLDELKALLPSRPVALTEVPQQEKPQQYSPQNPQLPFAEPRKVLNAEKVADQLGQLRSSVRQAILSSWALDEALDEIRDLSASERNKCRSATLAVTRIWLTAFGMIAGGAVLMAFVAFLILVTADLTQTLLDTATNTGVIAEGRPK
jgi:flagellar motility protein MotE (MotC chaperone)